MHCGRASDSQEGCHAAIASFFRPKKIFHAPGVLLRDQWFHFWNSWAADAISSNWSHFLKKIVGRSRNIPWQNHIICLEEKCEMWEVIFGVVINKFCIGTYLLIFSFNSVSNWINFVLCDFVKEYYQQLMIFFLKNDFSIGKVGQNFLFFIQIFLQLFMLESKTNIWYSCVNELV